MIRAVQKQVDLKSLKMRNRRLRIKIWMTIVSMGRRFTNSWAAWRCTRIRHKHIHDVNTHRLEYEIRGKYIHKINGYQPEFEIRGHYIHNVNSTSQALYEIR